MRRLLVVAGMLAIAGPVHAADVLSFVAPANNTEIDLGAEQLVYLRWTRGDRPVSGQAIALETTHGTISTTSVASDLNGFAVFNISASSAGSATITATGTGVSATLVLHFDNLSGATSLENPNGQMPIMIYTDRFAFRGVPGTSENDAAVIAVTEGLVKLRSLDDDLFVLGVGASIDRAAIRRLASEVQQRHSSIIEITGLVAKLVDAPQWVVIPEQVIVRFNSEIHDDDIAELLKKFGPTLAATTERDPDRFVMTLPANSHLDSVAASQQLSAMDADVLYAEPNYLLPTWLRADPTLDDGFKWQWHLETLGTYGGIDDADVDAALAWRYGVGSHETTIAVIDRGFDVEHPDLAANLWTKSPNHKGIDLIDGNGDNLHASSSNAGQFAHGTRAAGVAAAVGGNTIGYSGACPRCKLLLVKTDGQVSLFDKGIRDAVDAGAKVISNSWGGFGTYDDIRFAVDYAADEGVTVVFAISNTDHDNCIPTTPDTSAHPRAIAVGGVSDYDRRTYIAGHAMGYGACVDVVAPTYGGDQGVSTTSTKKVGSVILQTYYPNFSGTSAATPLVAGVAALLKDINSGLSPLHIQRLLQDTADRVEPVAAKYSAESGFSNPIGKSTHAYGRINAGEAARLAAAKIPADAQFEGGLGGFDLLLRDHFLDWGNTEQPSNTIFNTPREQLDYYKSVDIKIDVEPYQPQVITPEQFVNLASEEPEIGRASRVYVRLRNRGPETIGTADLKVIWALVDDTYPDLPNDFWKNFPGDHTDFTHWSPLMQHIALNVVYSGASVAGCPTRAIPECLPKPPHAPSDRAHIAMFSVGALDWDPTIHNGPAYFVVAHSADDPAKGMFDPATAALQVLSHVNDDNNVTLWSPGVIPVVPPAVAGDNESCDDDLVQQIELLIGIGIVLLILIIVFWSSNPALVKWFSLLLIIVLFLLLLTCMNHPGCIDDALTATQSP